MASTTSTVIGLADPVMPSPDGYGDGRHRGRAETTGVMYDDTALDDLVRSAQRGDEAALEEVLIRIRPAVLRRCSRFLPHRADAEEAAQDALMTISRKIASYAGRGSFLGWVTVVTSNAARATYRSLRDRGDRLRSLGVVPDAPDPRTTSVIAGTRLDLLEALDELEQRHPALVESFVLRDLGELSYAEIAEVTRTRLGTVKDRIHQARKFVQPRLRLDQGRPS
jgi:RNA polymerase sigma factor (sigma-70 family)